MDKLLKFEGKTEPLLPKAHFYKRLAHNALFGGLFILLFLLAGILGYHFSCHFSWIDSLLNASMILAGMGPINPILNDWGKLFASAYALASGVVFVTSIGILFAPIAHRIFHKFNLEEGADAL